MLGTDLDDSRVSRAEALARRLEAQILAGPIRPGDRLGTKDDSPFVRLGHQVLALKHEGVRAADCLQVRDALDPVIAVEAARHCSASDAAALRERMERMQAAAGDPTTFLRANWDLHRRIAEITPNSILRNLYTSLLDATESELTAVIPDSDFAGRVDDLLTLHREVVAAIVAGDEELARRAADRHVALTSRPPTRPPGLTGAESPS